MTRTKSSAAFLIAGLLLLVPCALFASGAGEEAAAGPTTIRWMMRWDDVRVKGVAMPIIEAFEKANPNIKIEFENIGKAADYYTKLGTLAAAGEMPDVTYLAPHYVAIYSANNVLMPLDELMPRYGIDPGAFYQKVLNFYKLGGKTYGVPIDAAALVMFYNKDMFDAAGVPYPQKGYTWDDLIAFGRKFVKDNDGDGTPDQFAVHLRSDYWPVMIKAETDHTVFDDYFRPTRFLLTEQASIDALQKYYDMWLVHKIAPTPDQIQQISNYFLAGKAAMYLIGSWDLPKTINTVNFNWDIAPIPVGKSGKEYNRGDGSAFCISAQGGKQEAAMQFVKFIAGPGSEGVGILLDQQQMLPAIKTMAESDRFLKPKPEFTRGLTLDKEPFFFGNENQFSMYDPIHPLYEKIDSILRAELTEAHAGRVPAGVAVERAAQQVNPLLKEVK